MDTAGSSAAEVSFTSAASRALERIATLIVPTERNGADCVRAAGEAVRLVLDDHSFAVVLYDRSEETWMDTPHPSGPHRADELPDGSDALAEQMRMFDELGADVYAWISTTPSLTAIISAVQEVGADAVLLPDPACDQRLLDRIAGRGSTNDDVAAGLEHHVERSITVFALDDETVDVLAVTEPGASRRAPEQ